MVNNEAQGHFPGTKALPRRYFLSFLQTKRINCPLEEPGSWLRILVCKFLLINDGRSLNLPFIFLALPKNILCHKFNRQCVLNTFRRMVLPFCLNLSAGRSGRWIRSELSVCGFCKWERCARRRPAAEPLNAVLRDIAVSFNGLWRNAFGNRILANGFTPKHCAMALAFQPRRFSYESLYFIIRIVLPIKLMTKEYLRVI
jgi:hypothetical protein